MRGILEIISRISFEVFIISYSRSSVVKVASDSLSGDDLLDFIFLVFSYYYWWQWLISLSWEWIVSSFVKAIWREDRMDFYEVWEFNSIGIAFVSKNGKGAGHLVIKFFTEALCLSFLGEYSDLVAHIKVNRLSFAFSIFNYLFLSSGHRLLSLISSFLHSLGCLNCLVVTHSLVDVCRLWCVSVKGCPCRIAINELKQWHFNTTLRESHLREVHHWQEFWPVVLIVVDKEPEALIQVLVHDLCLAICLQVKSSEEL